MYRHSEPKMFANKFIIVTGSSTGIGAGTVVKFAEEGAAGITIHGRQEAALKATREKIEKAGNGATKVHVVVGDVSDQQVRERLIKETIEKFGQIDVLVNNVGYMNMPKPTAVCPIEEYDKIFDINLRAMIIVTQLAIPYLEKTKGNIVNISSVGGLRASNMFTFYGMSKAAMDHFTRCMAVELGPKGIRVNSVNPGAIPETELASKAGAVADQVADRLKMYIAHTPLRRVGTVDEIARAILFLASDKASFITGISQVVDGGLVLG